jgi:hypothetical protein
MFFITENSSSIKGNSLLITKSGIAALPMHEVHLICEMQHATCLLINLLLSLNLPNSRKWLIKLQHGVGTGCTNNLDVEQIEWKFGNSIFYKTNTVKFISSYALIF